MLLRSQIKVNEIVTTSYALRPNSTVSTIQHPESLTGRLQKHTHELFNNCIILQVEGCLVEVSRIARQSGQTNYI